MDIYLAAAADSLSPRARTREDRRLVPQEDEYYARFASGPGLPHWVGRLIAAFHTPRFTTAHHARVARHA